MSRPFVMGNFDSSGVKVDLYGIRINFLNGLWANDATTLLKTFLYFTVIGKSDK